MRQQNSRDRERDAARAPCFFYVREAVQQSQRTGQAMPEINEKYFQYHTPNRTPKNTPITADNAIITNNIVKHVKINTLQFFPDFIGEFLICNNT